MQIWHLCHFGLEAPGGGWAGLDPVGGQQGFVFVRTGVVHRFAEHPFEAGEWLPTMAWHYGIKVPNLRCPELVPSLPSSVPSVSSVVGIPCRGVEIYH